MAGYEPGATLRASIFMIFLSISMFAVFLSCKDRCLFYDIADNYWMPFWIGIMGIFLGVFGVGVSCSRRSRSSRPCVGTVFCMFIYFFMFASLGCMLLIARPLLGHSSRLTNKNISDFQEIPFLTDFLHTNLTAIEQKMFTESLIHWGAMGGVALCLTLLSFVMTCMYCCCCQDKSNNDSPPKLPKRKHLKKDKNTRKDKQAHKPAANNQQLNMTTLQQDHIRPNAISQPVLALGDPRPPAYAPTLSGDHSHDATLFHNASAPHFSTSATLSRERDLARQQAWGSPGGSPPEVPNTPRPNTLDRPTDVPPEVPNTPRPNTLDRPTDVPPEVPMTARPSLTIIRTEVLPTSNMEQTSTDIDGDDYLRGYVQPNVPTTQTIESDYLLPIQSSPPGEYIEPIGDEPSEYHYAYEHDINSLARNQGLAGGVDNNSYTNQTINSRTGATRVIPETNSPQTINNNTAEDEETEEYNYAYDHDIESLSRNQGSNGVSYY